MLACERLPADLEGVLVMLGFALALGLAGAIVMVIVTIPATREGRGPWTWWARRRAERARRLAERPVATAEERFARGISLRRIVGVVLHALPRRRRRKAPRFIETGGVCAVEAGQAGVSTPATTASAETRAHASRAAASAARAAEAIRVAADAPSRPLREKVDERTYVAQVEAQTDIANEIVVMIKKRIPMPEVIEAEPIDADIVNPRILSRS